MGCMGEKVISPYLCAESIIRNRILYIVVVEETHSPREFPLLSP
jgi:hypothetical protein